ncbi:hypothetical protein [Flagellimonas sp. 389]|uniref:hypothetical protein n=1 Tax=Flagellimonas sp. 389 TaxID=2835862 RepID=UPI002022C238|nr:hypothetical protein [Flagellimonas sp. 389]
MNSKSLAEVDAQKTTELITQILKEEIDGYLMSSCITEKPRAVSHPMVSDFKDYLKDNLKIQDTTHLNAQSNLYKVFQITSDLVPDKIYLPNNNLKNLE